MRDSLTELTRFGARNYRQRSDVLWAHLQYAHLDLSGRAD